MSNLKALLVSMMLIIAGAIVLTQQILPNSLTTTIVGWTLVVFGMIIVGLSIKQEITA